MKKIEFSLVLPAYNEEKNIQKAISAAQKFLSKHFRSFEIVVVNDGSRDGTLAVLEETAKINKSLRIVNHRKNKGYGAAVWDGLKAAQGELIFFTDSDLQFDLNDLKPFLKKILTCDVVIGYRIKRVEGWQRRLNVFGWKIACYLALGIRFKDIDCAFKLFRREALAPIKIKSTGATFSAELLYKLRENGCNIAQLPVKHLPRLHGKSTGSKLSVILRAFKELYNLFLESKMIFNSRAKILGFLAVVGLFCSRFLFLSNSRDFFDSSEYLWRLKIPEMARVLTSGHPPFHPMYVGLASLFYKLGFTGHDGTTAGIIPSALLGCVAVIFAYLLSKNLFGRKIAALTAIVFAFLPFVYSSQLTILVDPTMHGFYFASLYLFAVSLDKKGRSSLIWASLAGLCLAGAAFTHTSIAFWITAYPAIWLIKIKKFDFLAIKKDIWKFVLVGFFALFAIAGYVYLLRLAYTFGMGDGKATIKAALKYLLLGNVSDRSEISLYLALKYYLTIATSVVGLLAILGFVRLIWKNFKSAIAFFIWFVPSTILTANYIYENLHGRAMMPALVPTVLLAVIFVLSIKNKYLKSALVILLIVQVGYLGFFAAAKYHSQPAPFEEIYMMQKAIEPGGVFISSNVTRTFNEYNGKFISFGDVGQGANEAEKAIENTLAEGKKSYISLDAIWYPRRRFDGMFYDIRANAGGRTEGQRTLLNNIFEEKNFLPVKMNSLFNQAFYEISNDVADRYKDLDARAKEHSLVVGRVLAGANPVSVASVNIYQNNLCMADKSDITYHDLGFCLFRSVSKSRDVEDWTFTDRSGWFYLPVTKNPSKITLGYSSEQTRINNQDGYFVKSGSSEVKGEKVGTFDLEGLKRETSNFSSFYAVSHVEGDQVRYDLYKFASSFDKISRIEGEDLPSEAGKATLSKTASSGSVMQSKKAENGYLVSGPYISLKPGRYQVRFHYGESSGGQVTFDVISDLGRNELAKTVISNITEKTYRDQDLEFEIKDASAGQNIEFRIKLENAALALDYIELTKI